MNAIKKIKTMNTAALYIREYGMAAYQAWLRREAEITKKRRIQFLDWIRRRAFTRRDALRT